MIAGIIGGLPGAGATMRTVININSGGKTRLSGVVASLLLAAILLGLGSLVGHIPNAVLAGILVTVGLGIIDYKGIKHLRSIPLPDAVIMFIVLLLTVFVDLLVAVSVGMVLAAFVFMKKSADMAEESSKVISLQNLIDEEVWEDEKDLVSKLGDEVFIKHLEGPLFFGMISGFKERFKTLPSEVKVVIIRMDKVPYVDQSGLYAMEDSIMELQEKGVKVLFYGLQEYPRLMFEKIDIIPDLVPEELCFDSGKELEVFLEKGFFN